MDKETAMKKEGIFTPYAEDELPDTRVAGPTPNFPIGYIANIMWDEIDDVRNAKAKRYYSQGSRER